MYKRTFHLTLFLFTWLVMCAVDSANVYAETVSGGVSYEVPDKLNPSTAYRINVHKGQAYLYGEYNPGTTLELIGQNIGQVRSYGGGVGIRQPIAGRLSVLGSVGYMWADMSKDNPVQRHEAVVDILRRDHVVLPWMSFYNPLTGQADFDDSAYKLSGGVVFRLGLLWSEPRYNVSLAYRVVTLNTFKQAWKGSLKPSDPINCNCLWQQRKNLSYSAAEFTLEFKI